MLFAVDQQCFCLFFFLTFKKSYKNKNYLKNSYRCKELEDAGLYNI